MPDSTQYASCQGGSSLVVRTGQIHVTKTQGGDVPPPEFKGNASVTLRRELPVPVSGGACVQN